MTHEVVFAAEARDDLIHLYLYIAERAGDVRALGYIERIESYCRGLADFPERGTRRDDLFPGLRVIGFGRRVTIAFGIQAATVTVYRILYGGRDLSALLDDDPS